MGASPVHTPLPTWGLQRTMDVEKQSLKRDREDSEELPSKRQRTDDMNVEELPGKCCNSALDIPIACVAHDGPVQECTLRHLLHSSMTLLLFLPSAFEKSATDYILSYSKMSSQFKQRGVVLIGVSVDSQYALYHWHRLPASRGGLDGKCECTFVSDMNHRLADVFGVYDKERGCADFGTVLLGGSGAVLYAARGSAQRPDQMLSLATG